MATVVTGSPVAAFADAIYRRLAADTTLAALATGGVCAATNEASRTNRPYIVVGNRELHDDIGAMQREGGRATVTVDVFSGFNGPEETQDIQSRIRVLLQRYALLVSGFALYAGSLVCETELCFADFDPDMPERSGFHGVQRWTGLLEEAL